MPTDTTIFDRDAALHRLRGDVALFTDVARFFHEDAPRIITALEEASRTNDVPSVVRAAHSLCGLAATFDAHETVAAAVRVEQFAKQHSVGELHAAVEQLTAAVARLDDALAWERES